MYKNKIFVLLLSIVFVVKPIVIKSHPVSDEIANLVEKLSPAVVNVFTVQKEVSEKKNSLPFDEIPPQFREFFKNMPPGFPFGPQQNTPKNKEAPQALGSGFVIDPTGYIVTNNHVIAGANEIKVKFQDEMELKAKIIGKDQLTDLALLKVENDKPLPFVKFADSDKARVGHSVIAIGNPFGLGGTVTSGIISAFNRDINSGPYDSFIQTDASINKGNSGGPLFNMDGDVIGVNTAILSPNGGSIGIGFSMSSAVVEKVIDQLKAFGETRRGWLGVRIQDVTEDVAEALGIEKTDGALVTDVPEGPAKNGGIKSGDVIIEFDGKKIKDTRELVRIVGDSSVGKKVLVKVLRDGKEVSLSVKLGRLEDNIASSQPERQRTKKVEFAGMTLSNVDREVADELGIDQNIKGVVIVNVKPGSVAEDKGLKKGDVIIQVNRIKISSTDELYKLNEEAKKAKKTSVLMLILRNGMRRFIGLPTQ